MRGIDLALTLAIVALVAVLIPVSLDIMGY